MTKLNMEVTTSVPRRSHFRTHAGNTYQNNKQSLNYKKIEKFVEEKFLVKKM